MVPVASRLIHPTALQCFGLYNKKRTNTEMDSFCLRARRRESALELGDGTLQTLATCSSKADLQRWSASRKPGAAQGSWS